MVMVVRGVLQQNRPMMAILVKVVGAALGRLSLLDLLLVVVVVGLLRPASFWSLLDLLEVVVVVVLVCKVFLSRFFRVLGSCTSDRIHIRVSGDNCNILWSRTIPCRNSGADRANRAALDEASHLGNRGGRASAGIASFRECRIFLGSFCLLL